MKIDKKSSVAYWLFKSEPESRIVKGKDVKFSLQDLQDMKVSRWDGVRNYEARNLLRDKIKVGDGVLFYHSNCKIPGIAGTAIVVKEGYVDETAFDSQHPYYDVKSNKDDPRWYCVDVEYQSHLERFIPLKELQEYKKTELKEMVLLNRGRLSIQPVSKKEFDFIQSLQFR